MTAGWDKSVDLPQRLVVEWSDDGGAHWQRAVHPDPALFGGVWSMAATIEAARTVHWLGLYRGGVMRIEWPQAA